MKIGIIECGRNRKAWQQHGEFGEWFPPLLEQAGQPFEYEIFNPLDGELPGDPRTCDSWLITGSPASVYDDAPWQQCLTVFLEKAVERQPVIGICYGHQHLHCALGGKVEKASKWGVGIQTYELRELPAWLPPEIAADSEDGFDLIALHQDQVTRLAPGSRTIAGNEFCFAGATTIGRNVLTFQAHPEMSPEFAAKVYEFERRRIGSARTDEAKRSLSGARDTELVARWIMAFIQHCLGRKQLG